MKEFIKNLLLPLLTIFFIGYIVLTPKVSTKIDLTDNYVDSVTMQQSPQLTNRKHREVSPEQAAYVQRFKDVAIAEMHKYGIPASIKLAQGLLESRAGQSNLATNNNNHFGIKCFSKSCSKGHCTNATDDSHKDFFRKYETAWESWRAHSEFLQKERYVKLQEYGKDYKAWAVGLKKAGYATDKYYAEKLIELIEDLELYKFDEL